MAPHEMPSRAEPPADDEPDPYGPWDDFTPIAELDEQTAAAVAMVECTHGDDTEGLAALLRYAEAPALRGICVSLAKLISEGLQPELITSGAFRAWAAHAVRRQ
jgi:hypothetical protein